MNTVLPRNSLFIVTAIFLFMDSPSLAQTVTKYTSSISSSRIALNSRPQPATPSSESENSLLRKGYFRIGSVNSESTVKQCFGNKCETFGPFDLKTETLMEAAARGGDLVTFPMDNQPSEESISKDGKCLDYSPGVTKDVSTYDNTGKYIGTRPFVSGRGCVEYEQIPGKRYLITRTGHVWRYDPEFATGNALVAGAAKGDLNWAKEILSETQDADLRNLEGLSALYSAASEDRTAIVKLLLDYGADPNTHYLGDPVLRKTAMVGNAEIARLLIANGADVPADILSPAVTFGHTAMVKILVAAGADVNEPSREGEPLLSIAQRKWYSDTAEILIKAGAMPLTQAQSDYVKTHKPSIFVDTRHGKNDFGIITLDGREIRHSTDLKDKKLVYLYFWTTWDPISRRQLGALFDMERKLGNRMQVIAINAGEEKNKVLQLIDQLDLKLTIGHDEDNVMAEYFEVSVLPTAVIIDKKGVVCMKDLGGVKTRNIDSVPRACMH